MIRANQACLEQALTLLDVLDDSQYASPRGNWSPVGTQLRHLIEHYQSFVGGLPDRAIDYDARPRDATIEASRHRAASALRELIGQLAALEGLPAETPVQVQMKCEAGAKGPTWAGSSVGRELQFLVGHAVHHFALIKLLVAGDGTPLDPDFGIAPSTLSHGRANR